MNPKGPWTMDQKLFVLVHDPLPNRMKAINMLQFSFPVLSLINICFVWIFVVVALKGAATLKARAGYKNRLNGSAPVLPIEESNELDSDLEKHRTMLAKGAQLTIHTSDGTLIFYMIISKFVFWVSFFFLLLILFCLLGREVLAEVSVHHPKQPSQGLIFAICLFLLSFGYMPKIQSKSQSGFTTHAQNILKNSYIIAGHSQDKEAESDEYFFKQEGKWVFYFSFIPLLSLKPILLLQLWGPVSSHYVN